MIERLARLLQTRNRLTLFTVVLCGAFIGGILFSIELWFPTSRSFPRAPILFTAPEASTLEWFLSTILIASLLLTAVSKNPAFFSAIALLPLSVLVCFDQSRLQPWLYQYSVLLIVLALHNRPTEDAAYSTRTFALFQLIVASVYFWSGLQKLNFTFTHEIFPALLTPLQISLPWLPPLTSGVGIGAALTETLIGCGLLYSRTRNLCVWLAVATHGIVLALLIAKGYNSVVWIWNFALMLVVLILFWHSDVYLFRGSGIKHSQSFKSKIATLVTFAASLLPFLSFLGWWDMYLSGALYSGNTPVAVVKVDREVSAQLPATAKEQLFRVASTGEEMLPLLEWSMAELNVPVYPEVRVYQQVAQEICKLATNKNDVDLVVKARPEIFSGQYKVTRISCASLDR
jgi:hypothetical protein